MTGLPDEDRFRKSVYRLLEEATAFNKSFEENGPCLPWRSSTQLTIGSA
jgi:hypothetical protein